VREDLMNDYDQLNEYDEENEALMENREYSIRNLRKTIYNYDGDDGDEYDE
jgi:hypothetical protein